MAAPGPGLEFFSDPRRAAAATDGARETRYVAKLAGYAIMVFTHKKARVTPVVRDEDEERGFPWLEGALAVSALALFFQRFPSIWASVVSFLALVFSYIDARGWRWRSYAVVCAIAITAMVFLKGRQDNV